MWNAKIGEHYSLMHIIMNKPMMHLILRGYIKAPFPFILHFKLSASLDFLLYGSIEIEIFPN